VIALTGPSGFVGSVVARAATERQIPVVPLVRQTGSGAMPESGAAARVIGDLGVGPIDHSILDDCSAVIHAAARAHRIGERGATALASYRRVNVAGTQALIEAMAQARTRRLIYVSSIKALGERSFGSPLRPNDLPAPEDPYGISKAEAEDVVHAAHREGRIEALIIRPVLVHGPGAKGNLDRLMRLVLRGFPPMVGTGVNRRSLVGISNLADAILMAATAPMPTPRTATRAPVYHICDDGVVSTRRLVEVIAEGLGVRPRFIPVPHKLTVAMAAMVGRRLVARRLFEDLEVDDSDFRHDFAWRPRLGLEEGLRVMAEDFARRAKSGG